jgi:hypothetical protein
MHASSLSNCSCRRELQSRGLEDVRYVEEEVEAAAVGKGSVAVGEVADSVEADLVVLSTAGGRVERAGGWVGGWACEAQRCCCAPALLPDGGGGARPCPSLSPVLQKLLCRRCSENPKLPLPLLQLSTRSTLTPTCLPSLWAAPS